VPTRCSPSRRIEVRAVVQAPQDGEARQSGVSGLHIKHAIEQTPRLLFISAMSTPASPEPGHNHDVSIEKVTQRANDIEGKLRKRHSNDRGIELGDGARGAAGMSHVMDNQLTILKRDARGRVRSTAEARAAAVAEYRRSGLSASAFAKMAGISKNTFWNWLQCHGLTQKRGPTLSKSRSPPADALCAGDGASGTCPGFARAPAWWCDRRGGR
jgi:hypothetical protein